MSTIKPKFVSNGQESTRMFKSDFLELFSKVHYTVPLFLFVPVVAYFVYKTFFVLEVNVLIALLFLVLGFFIWSFTEYVMHRFLFHYHPTSKFGQRIHFIFHGIHHDYPNDANRLVMAPAISIPLAFFYYYLFQLALGEMYIAPFFVGFVVGYLFYDMSHYAIHHATFKSGIWAKIKMHHMVHHYRDDENGYGVSSKFWDLIFRTDFKK